MSSQAQIDANRLNAQMSTGPVTGEGKAKSRFNSLKHGAYSVEAEVTGEDAEMFAARERKYFEVYGPQDPAELFHIKIMIASENEIDRCVLLEACALKALIARQSADSQNPLGEAVLQDAAGPNALEKLARRREAATRRWVRSEKLLMVALNERWDMERIDEQEAKAAVIKAEQAAKKAPAPAPMPAAVPPQPDARPEPRPEPEKTARPTPQTPFPAR